MAAAAPPKLWACIIGSDDVSSIFLTKDEAAGEANTHASISLSNAADGAEGEAWYKAIDRDPDMSTVGFPLPFGEGLNFCAPVIIASEEGVEAANGKRVFVVMERKAEEAKRGGVDPMIAATRVLAFATKAAAEERLKNAPEGWRELSSMRTRCREIEIGKGEKWLGM